jgi:ribosomal protein S18 acetylase RimI-like enzyme
MSIDILHHKEEIYQFLSKEPELQLYSIGDLDDFFWPKTIWFAEKENDKVEALALLYVGMMPPTLVAFCNENKISATKDLLNQIKPLLPGKFNAHLSPDLLEVFGKENVLQFYGHDYNMCLKKEPEKIIDCNIRQLKSGDLNEIRKLYSIAYPDNWFDTRMLETGKYTGYFENNNLVGIAGIHVYSKKYKVAALGNITTHPEFRGKQIAYKLTSNLCNDLLKEVTVIGLNVRSHNEAAINCYKKIGFEIAGSHDECLIHNQ